MNLTTNYLGMKLKNPLVPSASPLSQQIDNIRAMEDAGAAAIVMYSLFEEQIEKEYENMVTSRKADAEQEAMEAELEYE